MENNEKGTLPIGFSMSLAQNKKALDSYSNLSNEERERLNEYISSSLTSDEAKSRIENIISNLENNNH